MKRKTELYNLVVEEEKTIDNITELNELKRYVILKDFLEYYYIKFNCDINDNAENTMTEEDITITEETHNYTDNNALEEVSADICNSHNVKIDLKSKSICYYIKSIVETQHTEDTTLDKTRNVSIDYIKYDKRVKVVDKNTLEEKFTKSKDQGDLEKQHYVIRSFSNINRALIVWEKILGAVTISSLEKHINSNFRKWIKEKYKEDEDIKTYLLKYNIKIYAVPSNNFIEEIEKMDKISLTTDEDILYSEENIARDYVDLNYKPVKGKCFTKPKVVEYFNKFKTNNNIKRLVIKGRRQGSSVSLDTELMKMSEYIDICLDDNGLANSDDLFRKYNYLMNSYYETLSDNYMDLDIDEGEC